MEKGKGGTSMTGNKARYRNGFDYPFGTFVVFEEEQSQKALYHIQLKTKHLRGLRKQKAVLLGKIEACKICPESFRRTLYKDLQCIDISKNEASAKLDKMSKDIDIVAFNLQLNPAWVRGLLKLTDEVLDQTNPEQRKQLSAQLNEFKAALDHLKKDCKLYQFEILYL